MRYSIFDAVLVVLRPSSEVLLLGDGLHDDFCQELSTFPCRMDAVGLHDAIGGHAFSRMEGRVEIDILHFFLASHLLDDRRNMVGDDAVVDVP